MSVITINEGTQTSTPSDTVGGNKYPISKIDVGAAGSSVPWQGTVTLGGGTVQAGTINSGTVETSSIMPPNEWGTVINSGTNTFGTLKAAVAGSTIYITDLTINVGSASNVCLYDGGTANPLYGTVQLGANGGLVSNFKKALHGTSGSAVTYQQSANIPLMIQAQGFVK